MSTVIIPVIHYINNKIKRLECLRALARSLNFSFSKEITLVNKMIGLDSMRRKLFILKKNNKKPVCCIVDLRDIESCSVKKTYSCIIAGGLKSKKLEEYLDSISLHLGFKNGKEQMSIAFYENRYNSISELQALEAKAKNWERLVSHLLYKPTGEGVS